MPAIETTDLTKRYGDVTALAGVDLTVEDGEAVGVVGTNGAGKTTLFRLLVGHERPDSGRLRVCGRDPTVGTDVRREVGYLPQDAGFHPTLTGREVLEFHATLRGVPASERDRRVQRVLATVGLVDAADRSVGGYSGGMERRLGLGTVLVTRPSVLLLDEPTAGLDPRGVAAFDEVMRRVRDETGVTIVLATHDLEEVERLCDRAVVLDGGVIRAEGTIADLSRRADETVTVTARLSPEEDLAPVEALRDRFGAASVDLDHPAHHDGPTADPDGERAAPAPGVTVRCPREDAAAVVAELHDRAEVLSFEVREPGLASAFRAATDSEGDGTPNAGGETDATATADGGETA